MDEVRIEEIKNVIRKRIEKRVPIGFIQRNIMKNFYVGGNSLNRVSPNDIDIFPVKGNYFSIHNFSDDKYNYLKVLSKTKNAVTTKIVWDGEPYTVQFCHYAHESLESLVNSFDFSHIQVGVYISEGQCKYTYPVYFTDNYLQSKIEENTKYVGSEYPLSSLIRSFKYVKRKDFSGKSYIMSVISIINDIIERKFYNYEDFKDQLDAVDLGLVPENLKDVENSDLLKLFHLLAPKEEHIMGDDEKT